MAAWIKVARCKECGRIYSNGVPEVCYKCGINISNKDGFLNFMGVDRCMTPTENLEYIIARKRLFHKWEIKS